MGAVRTVVFDLGGVLVDWNPRYLLRDVMPGREEEMERLIAEALNHDWNLDRDRGDSWPDAMLRLKADYPEWADVFDAFDARWSETMGGDLPETVAILAELREAGVPLLALSNWSAEKFPIAEKRFEWMAWFDATVVSGRIKLVKPDAAIYHYLLDTYSLDAADTFFIDDRQENIEAAEVLGITGHHFRGAPALRRDLQTHGLLP